MSQSHKEENRPHARQATDQGLLAGQVYAVPSPARTPRRGWLYRLGPGALEVRLCRATGSHSRRSLVPTILQSGSAVNKYNWALHFVSAHKVIPGTPSLEEMLKYPQAFIQMFADHKQLHARFHTGHEHDPVTGAMIAPKIKPKVSIEVVDD